MCTTPNHNLFKLSYKEPNTFVTKQMLIINTVFKNQQIRGASTSRPPDKGDDKLVAVKDSINASLNHKRLSEIPTKLRVRWLVMGFSLVSCIMAGVHAAYRVDGNKLSKAEAVVEFNVIFIHFYTLLSYVVFITFLGLLITVLALCANVIYTTDFNKTVIRFKRFIYTLTLLQLILVLVTPQLIYATAIGMPDMCYISVWFVVYAVAIIGWGFLSKNPKIYENKLLFYTQVSYDLNNKVTGLITPRNAALSNDRFLMNDQFAVFISDALISYKRFNKLPSSPIYTSGDW